MSRIKIGLQCQPQHATFDGMRAAWTEAEEIGADSLWNWDHFFPLYGDPDGLHYEAIATLGAMAQVTERATIGSLVICNSYRNPELLVDAHRTLDHISGGRTILGIGAGWFEKDYDEYGYEFGEARDRLAELRRALPRIEARKAKLNPQPVGDLPILIGGSGPKVTLKLVAQHAQLWHSFGDLEAFHKKDGILREHCAAVGRDPEAIERTWAAGSEGFDADLCEQLVDAGVSHLIIGIGGDGSGYDLGPLRELAQWRDGRGD